MCTKPFSYFSIKHTLWINKRTISMRRFFWTTKTYVKTHGQEIIKNFRLKYVSNPMSGLHQNFFLISQAKHMLWVLKRTVLMRRFFEHQKHNMFNLMGKKISQFYAKIFLCVLSGSTACLYSQFDSTNLEAALDLLLRGFDGYVGRDQADPIVVCRKLAAIVSTVNREY